MGVLGQYGGRALMYWDDIIASAYKNASTADMWASIHRTQANYGLPKPGASAIDATVLRGFANRIANGSRALNAAADSDSITADMMAVAPYTSGTYESIATSPTYHVRFKNTVEADDGTVTTTWQTAVYTNVDMPDTVGALRDSIDSNATELAAQGGASDSNTPRGVSLSTSDYEITLV